MRRPLFISVLLLAFVAIDTAPVSAQNRGAGGVTGLDGRMRRFLAAMPDGWTDGLAGFFPRAGELRRVVTLRRAIGPDSVEVRRFAVGALRDAAEPGGPLCHSFQPGTGTIGAAIGSLAGEVEAHPRGWRRVRGNRFVPPGQGAGSPVFVEWEREGGRWVIAAFGEEADYAPRVLGADADPLAIRRDPSPGAPVRLPLADARYAAGAPWYETHQVLRLDGLRYLEYGLPRQLKDGDVVRIGSVQGVGVYVEPGQPRRPDSVFLAVNAGGSFQPYMIGETSPCALGAPEPRR